MKILKTYLFKEKRFLGFAFAAVVISQVFSLMNPQIIARIIDDYGANIQQFSQSEFITGVGRLLLLYMLIALVARTAKAFQDYFVSSVSEKVSTRLYGDSVRHVFTLPFGVFEDQQSGSILQKMQKARDNVKTLIANTVNIGIFSAIGILFVLGHTITVHPIITALFAGAIAVVAVVIFKLGKSIKLAQTRVVKKSAELAASTTETLQNVGLVKALGLEKQEIDRLNVVNNKIFDLEIHKILILRKLSFIQGTMVNTIRCLVIFVSMVLIFQGAITLGQFLTLWLYSFFVLAPLAQISTLVSSYQEAKASLEEVDAILALQPDRYSNNADLISVDLVQNIVFDDVSFLYASADDAALQNVSLQITAGQTIALVGPSGSGKSTLLKLILGLYQPTHGSVLYNNQPFQKVAIESVRQKVGYVPQDTQVFAGTIRDNLLFVAPNATDEECIDVLKKAQVYSIVQRGHEGLSTKIGENGIKLSGGERQRIAIARALLRKPNVLIFDEATSSLDSLTEQEITTTIKNIRKQYPDLIMIMVAHRLSTVEHADIIYALKNGQLIESGSHDELLNQKGLYFSLWNQQS